MLMRRTTGRACHMTRFLICLAEVSWPISPMASVCNLFESCHLKACCVSFFDTGNSQGSPQSFLPSLSGASTRSTSGGLWDTTISEFNKRVACDITSLVKPALPRLAELLRGLSEAYLHINSCCPTCSSFWHQVRPEADPREVWTGSQDGGCATSDSLCKSIHELKERLRRT